jgi:hypothetical protein
MLPQEVDRCLDLVNRKQGVRLGSDVGDEPSSAQDVGRHWSLEFAVPNEHHHGMETSGIELEKIFHGPPVLVVLMQRILELVFPLEEDLRPPLGPLVTEDPTGEVLRFNHEDPKLGYDDVVHLRGPIRGLYG